MGGAFVRSKFMASRICPLYPPPLHPLRCLAMPPHQSPWKQTPRQQYNIHLYFWFKPYWDSHKVINTLIKPEFSFKTFWFQKYMIKSLYGQAILRKKLSFKAFHMFFQLYDTLRMYTKTKAHVLVVNNYVQPFSIRTTILLH